MGAWRRCGRAAVCLAALSVATRSAASTQVEPIARLTLESGYDTNTKMNPPLRTADDVEAVKQGLRARVKAAGFLGTSFLSLEYVDPRDHPTLPVPCAETSSPETHFTIRYAQGIEPMANDPSRATIIPTSASAWFTHSPSGRCR